MTIATSIPARVAALAAAMEGPAGFITNSTWAARSGEPGISDFTFGNPHEMPLPAFIEALRSWSVPLHKDWFAYHTSAPEAQRIVARSLERRTGQPFAAEDIALTNGGIAALSIGMKAVSDPGDEVIYATPGWFNYSPMIVEAGLTAVTVELAPGSFDLDLDAIEAAITPRARIVVVNTPHNPSGRVYSTASLDDLARRLEHASERLGRAIYILSDEPYYRLVFDGGRAASPAEFYPRTLIAYSFAKALLTPGQRIGFLAVPPEMPGREQLRASIQIVQIACGWAFPNALLQHALPDLEPLSINIEQLQRKRDHMLAALRTSGYEAVTPEGTYYLWVRSPLEDDVAFSELLAARDVFVMPGSLFDGAGYFRISLTATEEMIERALPIFAEAWERAAGHRSTHVNARARGM